MKNITKQTLLATLIIGNALLAQAPAPEQTTATTTQPNTEVLKAVESGVQLIETTLQGANQTLGGLVPVTDPQKKQTDSLKERVTMMLANITKFKEQLQSVLVKRSEIIEKMKINLTKVNDQITKLKTNIEKSAAKTSAAAK